MRNRTLPYMNAYGTADISTASTIEEALELAGLNWEVQVKQLFDEDGNPYDNFKANIRETDDKLLGIVTDRYQLVQNREAFTFVDELVGEGFRFDRAGQFRDGRSIWVMGQLPETEILGDKVSNNIIFTNSHDGFAGVKVMMTPVRIVCSNMLNLALKKAERTWSVKHTGKIITKLEEAKRTLNFAEFYMSELNEEAERLADMKISDDKIIEIFDALYPVDKENDSQKRITNIDVLRQGFIQCYNEGDIKQFRGTVYGAVNAYADLIDHRDPDRVTTNFYENEWCRLISGNKLDSFYRAATK